MMRCVVQLKHSMSEAELEFFRSLDQISSSSWPDNHSHGVAEEGINFGQFLEMSYVFDARARIALRRCRGQAAASRPGAQDAHGRHPGALL
jgi:hypothetical protein